MNRNTGEPPGAEGIAMVRPDRVYVRREGVFDAWMKDELVLLCLERDRYFSLDEIGARIWQLLEGGRSAAAICKVLTDEYDIAQAMVAAEVGALLAHMIEQELIRPAGPDD